MSNHLLAPLALAVLSTLAACSKAETPATPKPLAIKVVVVTMFEDGAVTGDKAGEFQNWVEGKKLDTVYPFPMGKYELRGNDDGLLAICTGMGIGNASASIMALGTDPRFDLSHAYFLIAGIGGGDPHDVSLGTAVWSKHVVDGDLLYEIDAREIPKDWPYGLLPLGGQRPNDTEHSWTVDTLHFALNPTLTDWAYQLSKDHPVADSDGIARFRAQFSGYPNALKAPFVVEGDTMSSSRYFHGDLMTQWANDWMKLQAGADANFMISAMEDSGTLTALHRLAADHRVDLDRVLVLRTASNYSMQPPGKDAAWSTTAEYPEDGKPAIDAAYQVGGIVVQKLLDGWSTYRDQIPGN